MREQRAGSPRLGLGLGLGLGLDSNPNLFRMQRRDFPLACGPLQTVIVNADVRVPVIEVPRSTILAKLGSQACNEVVPRDEVSMEAALLGCSPLRVRPHVAV